MPVVLSHHKAASEVTTGEILCALIWLLMYGVFIVPSVSGNFDSLLAAINVSGVM
jgi:hypothetical protein